jgi:peptide/nickel transport system permease protein
VGGYLLKRLLQFVPVLFLVSLIVFSLAYHMPGDPVRLLMGQNADPVAMDAKRTELGLNRPFHEQYASYMGKVLRGNLGISYAKKGKGVSELIVEKLAVTARLAVLATLLSVIFGVGAGILSAVRPYSWADYGAMLLALLGVSVPVFYLGFLLFAFVAPHMGLPVSGFDDASIWTQFRSLILPATALGALETAILARLTRATMLETLSQDYVRTARSKGLSEAPVVLKHATPPSPSSPSSAPTWAASWWGRC